MFNKKAVIGREWAYTLSFIFGLSVLVFIFNMVFNYNLAPTFIDLMPNTTAGVAGVNGINKYLDYWKFIPYFILASALVYLAILTIKREPTERYYD